MTIHVIRLGKIVANCYLIEHKNKFMLVDTGRASKKAKLMRQMKSRGCNPEDLTLIVMTHGHFDHTGLGAWFMETYQTPLLMHRQAAMKVESGDMFFGSTKVSGLQKWLVNKLFIIDTFTPNLIVDEGISLEPYGFNGRIILTPGHSNGSISILLEHGQLISGDLFENQGTPKLNSIMDNFDEAQKSLDLLRDYSIDKVYPGHGDVFEFSSLV